MIIQLTRIQSRLLDEAIVMSTIILAAATLVLQIYTEPARKNGDTWKSRMPARSLATRLVRSFSFICSKTVKYLLAVYWWLCT